MYRSRKKNLIEFIFCILVFFILQKNSFSQCGASIPNPTVTVTSSNVSCFGSMNGSISASSSGGTLPYTYAWNTGQSTSAISGMAAGNYSLVVTDVNGCMDTAFAAVTEPMPLVVISSPDDTVCAGQSVTISASASGGTLPYSYFWSQSAWIGAGPHNVNQNITATYTVNIIDANGCISPVDSTTIFVYPFPTVIATDVKVCEGQSATITATPAAGTGGPYTYAWSNGVSAQSQIVTVPLNQSPKIFIVVVNDGCTSISDTATVLIDPLPTGTITVNGNSGCTPFTTSFSVSGSNASSYFWNFGDGNSGTDSTENHTYTSSGIFLVSVSMTTNAGCSATISGTTFVNVFPTPLASCGTSTAIHPMTQSIVQFTNNSSGATNYLWDFGDGNSSTQENPLHHYTSIGNYFITLIASNSNGCSDTCTMETYGFEISFPNAFTPNQSGPNGGAYNIYNTDNDVFFPFASGISEYKMAIFNRWGELIFETTDINTGWDGYYRGKLCQQDVYVWKTDATFLDGTKFHKAGDVTLLR